MPTLVSNTGFSLLIGFIIVLGWIALYYRDKYNKSRDDFLDLADSKGFFSKKTSIMRKDERKLYDILERLYGNTYYIYPQVRLAALLDIKNDVKDHDNLYREIDHYSIDFVFFDKTNITPLLAIELNGASHFQMNRRNRDQKISNILTKSGIQFITIPVLETYNEGELQKQIESSLKA